MQRSFGIVVLGSFACFLGCSSPAQARPCPVDPTSAEPTSSATGPQAVTPVAAAPVAPTPGTLPEAASAAPSAPAAESTASPASTEPTEALPELKVKLSGMHIGGGPNDVETKRPFISVIEGGFERMRLCYQKAEEPGKGGTFGVDLRIEREGGHPTVQAVRTAMKGEELRRCLEGAFQGLEFGKPAKGATVLSASVHFELAL